MSNVISLPASEHFNPEQALQSAVQLAEVGKVSEVLILGYDENDSLIVRSSHMDRKSALYLLEEAKYYIMGLTS